MEERRVIDADAQTRRDRNRNERTLKSTRKNERNKHTKIPHTETMVVVLGGRSRSPWAVVFFKLMICRMCCDLDLHHCNLPEDKDAFSCSPSLFLLKALWPPCFSCHALAVRFKESLGDDDQ